MSRVARPCLPTSSSYTILTASVMAGNCACGLVTRYLAPATTATGWAPHSPATSATDLLRSAAMAGFLSSATLETLSSSKDFSKLFLASI